MEINWPDWAPTKVKEWLEKVAENSNLPRAYLEFCARVSRDDRMKEFWAWLPGAAATSKATHVTMLDPLSVCGKMWRLTRLPGKPGNMTPKQREKYFEQVRKHAGALLELLEGTRFDSLHETELTRKILSKTLDDHLYGWGDDEEDEGHIVAFRISPDGKYELDYNFPESALRHTLTDVIDWTHWDDQWDGNFMKSSAPIRHANTESAPIIFFTCSFFEDFAYYGIHMPFSLLADVTNVALELETNREVDEESVRKQVRRYQERRKQSNLEDENPWVDTFSSTIDSASDENPF